MALTLVFPQGRDRDVLKAESSCVTISDAAFVSAGTVCRGSLFSPPEGQVRAMLVMAPDLGGTVDSGLASFAERLAQSGIKVLAFDYRFFGQSNGKPRQFTSIQYQLTDWRAALTYAQKLEPSVPLVLWGAALSSAHALSIATERSDIAAVIASNPIIDGFASVRSLWRSKGLLQGFEVAKTGLWDLARGWFARDPLLIPMVGKPSSLAAMTTPGALDSFHSIAPDHFVNTISPGILLSLGCYRPIRRIARIRCPVLLQLCLFDEITPRKSGYQAAARIGEQATVKTYDIDHFGAYQGSGFQELVRDQLHFLDTCFPLKDDSEVN
ncbi:MULTISPECIES: alpha/beta hydrolase [Vreelandella]|uniref:Alpha/beta hydrolase n=2 Tax=Vreelandella TaxID=3137766 RepID=A0A7C9P325_9GAMM|nr:MULTISPECIES: alpha/beta hydrolase [Halomonas]NDL69396.1 alpha/beta hydrolase [Halomonas alkaliphila]NYS43896.1 alpha/beta hydrolase [Halomonas zhaodongensis]